MEGTCNGQYGFILGVLGIADTGRGLLREGTGAAVFNLKYSCICFKPFKGEVMDVVVTSVNKAREVGPAGRWLTRRNEGGRGGGRRGSWAQCQLAIWRCRAAAAQACSRAACRCPPAAPLLSPATPHLPRPLQMGFFAEAGPLQVFVSNHLIPEAFEFNTAHEPCYQTSDGEQKVVPGSEVRLRIVGTRVDAADIVSVGAGRGGRSGAAAAAPCNRAVRLRTLGACPAVAWSAVGCTHAARRVAGPPACTRMTASPMPWEQGLQASM